MKPIAILGAGPAGLMAAHACSQANVSFSIFSHPVKSHLGGAQFLHHEIPGLTPNEPDGTITYLLDGYPETYQQKVYGDNPHVPFVSMSFVQDGLVVPAWSLRSIYDGLWDSFSHGINPTTVDPQWLKEHEDEFEFIISGMPRDRLCVPWANHQFMSHRIKIMNSSILGNIPDNTICYDGTRDRSWYRCSKIFGVGSTEWGGDMSPPLTDLISVRKPLRTNCDCWPDMIRVGRFGRWEKGVLAHDGYERIKGILDAV